MDFITGMSEVEYSLALNIMKAGILAAAVIMTGSVTVSLADL